MRGSTPVYLSIDLIASNASTNGGFKHSRIDENLPPNQPADAILWGYDNATSQRSVFRKLTLRLTTTGNSIDTEVGYNPMTFTTSNALQDVSARGSFTVTGTTLNWTAVPEPTTALTGLLLTAGLLRRRRA